MEWLMVLAIILGSLLLLLFIGIPVAFAFLFADIIGIVLFCGGVSSLPALVLSAASSIDSFVLVAVPLFLIMGEVIFESGIAARAIEVLDQWIGRLPGRLSLEAIGAGVLFATLSGSNMASVCLLGSALAPEMEKRNYKKEMIFGPILGSGSLAIMIPPSASAIVLSVIAEISVGKMLVAIIVPGLLMALVMTLYVVIRCICQPALAPAYEVKGTAISKRTADTGRYVLPLGLIFLLVMGLVFVGIATPSESAATGAIGCYILAVVYGKLNWELVKKTLSAATRISVMVLMIMTGASAFSQILSFTGVGQGLVGFVSGINVHPLLIVGIMQLILLVLGCFMEAYSIMMIAIPIFFPIITVLGLDPIWFGVLFILNMDMGGLTPPFGLSLFVMKAVSPQTKMSDIILCAMPFVGLDLLVLILLIVFPQLALWLPGLMFSR